MKSHPTKYSELSITAREDFSILHVDSHFARVLGYGDGAEILETFGELSTFWSQGSLDCAKRAVGQLRGRQRRKLHCFYRRKGGDYVFLASTFSRAQVHGQSVIHVQIDENTLLTPASVEVEPDELRFQRAFEQQQQFVSLLSPDGRIEEANEYSLIIQGVERNDYIGKYFWTVPAWELLPEWQDIIKSRLQEVAKSETTLLTDDVYQSREGGIRYARVYYTPIRDELGDLQQILVQAIDVTDQKVSELILRDNQQRLELAMAAASMGTWEWNVLNDKVSWSDETFRIFRLEKPLFASTFESYLSRVVPESRDKVKEHCVNIIRRSKDIDIFKYDHEILRGDGSRGWVEVRGKIFLGENSHAARITGISVDITEAKRKERELLILYRAMESSSSSVIVTNLDRRIEYVNTKFSDITGYSKEEAIGQSFDMMNSGETPEAVYDELWRQVGSGADWKGEFRNRKKNGRLYWERASISSVKNQSGDITHFIAIQEDVTHEIEMSEKINYQASHDALTGLINRYEFERHIKGLPNVDGVEHALCFLDLDQFKIVNDTCGHVAGDELLRQLSPVLKKIVTGRGILARLGGDEFAVFLEACSVTLALTAAKEMLEAVEDFQFTWEGHIFRLGVSIGLVPVPSFIPKFSELLKQADTACYMAKDAGRNRIHVYYPDDVDITTRHGEMQWASRIYDALDNNSFCLFAQVILPLQSMELPIYELLIRMRDSDGTIIPPGAFISAAERYNMVTKIDRWVVKNALTLLSDFPKFLREIDFISMNLSGQSIADVSTRDFIIGQLVQHGVDGSKICFEITETAAILNLVQAEEFICELKKLGCRFALDDFGSGVSSFGYLKKLPVDYLKIDGMFVKDIVDDPIDHAMVKSINEIGQTMGMMTIAEFVENKAIETKLRALGVDYAQGHGVGEPQAVEDLLRQSK